MSAKKFTLFVLSLLGTVLVGIAALVIIVDPLFHYHAPLSFLSYRIDNSMYQNDGILTNFDYNAVIVGTSQSQNFKTSQAEDLFGYHFVKTPLPGANYIETNELLVTAFESDNDIELVIRNVDYSWLADTTNKRYYEGLLPEYLYDDNIFNDVQYWYSRDVLIRIIKDVFLYTLQGNETTSFDVYNNWSNEYPLGADAFLNENDRYDKVSEDVVFAEGEAEIISQNAYDNFVQVAMDHPDTTFYIFYSPYSIAYWDMLDRIGEVNLIIDAKLLVTEQLFKADNIRVFSYDSNQDVITNLDLYRDYAHYGQSVSDDILNWLSDEAYELTPENYIEIIEADREFLLNYDYDALYE